MENKINLYDLFTPEAYSEFMESKLFYFGDIEPNIISELKRTAQLYEQSPNAYIEYINILLKNNILLREKVEENISTVLLTILTNVLRPYLYDIISKLNEKMKKYGQFIISGGEAFNLNVPKEYRKLTPDIDTKFIPFINSNTMPNEEEYASIILQMREYFWYDVLEEILKDLNSKKNYTKLYNEILFPLQSCPEFKLFNFKFLSPNDFETRGLPFRKRLTLFPKQNNPEKMMFYDVNLFAIDLFVDSYSFTKPQMQNLVIVPTNEIFLNTSEVIQGLLDLPFMRPGEFAYDIGYKNNNIAIMVDSYVPGISFPVSSCLSQSYLFNTENILSFQDKIVRIASGQFLLEDIDTMLELNLRGSKSAKDQYRQNVLSYILKENIYKVPSVIVEDYIPNDLTIRSSEFISTAKLEKAFWTFNLNYIRLSKILKFLAPPTIILDNGQVLQNGIFNINIIRDVFNTVEPDVNNGQGISRNEANKFIAEEVFNYLSEGKDFITLDQWANMVSQFTSFYVEETYGIRYNYETKTWIENCCATEPKNIDCCDPIGNQFRFRINNREFSVLIFFKTEKVNEIFRLIFEEIGNFIDSIETNIVQNQLELAKMKLGVMLYEYNPNYADCTSIPVIISNILILVESFRWADPIELAEYANFFIMEKLLNLRKLSIKEKKLGINSTNETCKKLYRDLAPKRKERYERYDEKDFQQQEIERENYEKLQRLNQDEKEQRDYEEWAEELGIKEYLEGTEIQETPVVPYIKSELFDIFKLPTDIFVYKGMEKMSDEQVQQKLIKLRKGVPSFYTTRQDIAELYSKLYHQDETGSTLKCKTIKELNLLNLGSAKNLSNLINGSTNQPPIMKNKEMKVKLSFIFGYNMTSLQQYQLFEQYSQLYNIDISLYNRINDELVQNNTDHDVLKRCSLYDIDVEVMKYLCNILRKYNIDGFYIPDRMRTNYCTVATESCNGFWHDEVIFCNAKTDIYCENI